MGEAKLGDRIVGRRSGEEAVSLLSSSLSMIMLSRRN